MKLLKNAMGALLASVFIGSTLASRINPTCITNGFSYAGENGHTSRVVNTRTHQGTTLFNPPVVRNIATSFSNQYLNLIDGNADAIPLDGSGKSVDAFYYSCCDTWFLEATSLGSTQWHLSNMQPGMSDSIFIDAVQCFEDNRRLDELEWDIDDVNGDLEVRFKLFRVYEID